MGASLDMSHDWRDVALPDNIVCETDCFLQSAHIFGLFRSKRSPGLRMEKGSGIYSQSQLVVGEEGTVSLGEFACVNSATLECQNEIRIGPHCLIGWGAVISDCAPQAEDWREYGRAHQSSLWREMPLVPGAARPVVLERNVWVGFGSIIMPGVTIGEGSIIGSKTVIAEDVPPYVVVAGSPARIVRELK